MKTYFSLIFLLIAYSFVFSQDFQVTNMQGASVSFPKFVIDNNTTYLTFPTNMRFWKFPATGPQSPINNPVNPDPYQWGPFQCDIGARNNFVYLIYTDYGSGNFVVKVTLSNNYGVDWFPYYIVDTIQVGYTLDFRNDLPKVIISETGMVYFFYYVFKNNRDTSGIYLHSFHLGTKKVDTFFPSARQEYAITPFVKTINNVDHLYLSYWIDSTFYYIKSTDNGQTFSSPQVIQPVSVMFPPFDWESTFQMDNSGKLYFKYDYMEFMMPFGYSRKTLVKTSTNLGQTWSAPVLIDTNYNYVDLRVIGNKFVKFAIDMDMNLYMQTSTDLINWSAKMRVNTIDSSVVGHHSAAHQYNDKIAFAWMDKRRGHHEIFYRVMDIPTQVEESNFPEHFILQQNYPNPFNPITNISFTLNNKAFTSLKIYDVFGKICGTLVNNELEAGEYNFQFDGAGLSSGVYFYELVSGKFKSTKKMILIK